MYEPSFIQTYGILKNHQNDAPISSVVSYINSPIYKMGIQINSIFEDLTKFDCKSPKDEFQKIVYDII